MIESNHRRSFVTLREDVDYVWPVLCYPVARIALVVLEAARVGLEIVARYALGLATNPTRLTKDLVLVACFDPIQTALPLNLEEKIVIRSEHAKEKSSGRQFVPLSHCLERLVRVKQVDPSVKIVNFFPHRRPLFIFARLVPNANKVLSIVHNSFHSLPGKERVLDDDSIHVLRGDIVVEAGSSAAPVAKQQDTVFPLLFSRGKP